jgi:Family of unknown function (DUF6326)
MTVEVGPARRARRTGRLLDARPDVKVVLAGLWISMLFVFAFVDILGFWRDDVIRGALRGQVPDSGAEINQTFLALATVYVLVPSIMVAGSLLAPARINRPANLVVSVVYLVSVFASAVGENWTYYILGSVVEAILLVAIAGVAWRWPQQSDAPPQRA